MNRSFLMVTIGLLSTSTVIAETSLDPIIITATRTAESADETLAPVTVITREEIEKHPQASLPELLIGRAGIDGVIQGGYGKNSSLYLRGTNTGHTLVLVDGVRIGSATLGEAGLHYIPTDQIDRIEIVRGPRSSLYGSDAVGGVIQIFTRKAKEEGIKINARAEHGSHNTYDFSSGFSSYQGDTRYSLQLSHFSTEGINVTNTDNGGYNPDKDGYESNSVSASLSHRLTDKIDIGFNLLNASATNEYDTFNAFYLPADSAYAEVLQRSLGASTNITATDNWEMIFKLGQSLDESDEFVDDSKLSTFNTRRTDISWQNNITLGEQHLVSLGTDYLNDEVTSTTVYSKSSRDNRAVFAQYQGQYGEHSVQLGLRDDDNEAFGHKGTGNISWGYNPTPQLRLLASYATAFKAPTMNDLYYIDPFGFGNDGNPDLAPEKSNTAEIGIQGKPLWGSWEVRAFQTKIDDLIEWQSTDPTNMFAPWQPTNIGEAQIDGVEADMSANIDHWQLGASMTLLDPVNTTTDKQLPFRTRENVTLSLGRQYDKAAFNISSLTQGERYSDSQNINRTRGYTIFNTDFSYIPAKDWKITASVKNLMDKDYQTSYSYETLGRELFVGVSYQAQ